METIIRKRHKYYKDIKCPTCGKLRDIEVCRFKSVNTSCKKCSFIVNNTRKYDEIIRHKCSRCGYDRIKQVLQLHHIDRNRKNNNPSNIEVLCPTCHMEEHFHKMDGPYHSMKVNK